MSQAYPQLNICAQISFIMSTSDGSRRRPSSEEENKFRITEFYESYGVSLNKMPQRKFLKKKHLLILLLVTLIIGAISTVIGIVVMRKIKENHPYTGKFYLQFYYTIKIMYFLLNLIREPLEKFSFLILLFSMPSMYKNSGHRRSFS